MGHEPLPPIPTVTFFGTPVTYLPNIWTYIQHIDEVDGRTGCYRGLFPWIFRRLVYRYSVRKIESIYPPINVGVDEEELSREEKDALFVNNMIIGVISRTVAVVASQPLHVINVRAIAQFVGQETKYSGIFSPILSIMREDGVGGFFTGLLPRLLHDILCFTVSATTIFLARKYIIINNGDVRKMADLAIELVVTALFYPLQVVSTCMAVTNSGLAAGSPPNMPHYPNMLVCYRHLLKNNAHRRGCGFLFLKRHHRPLILPEPGAE